MKRKSVLLAIVALSLTAACSSPSLSRFGPSGGVGGGLPAPETVEVQTLDPTPAPRPPAEARTVSEFDTTTEEDRNAALAKPAAATSTELGTTLATLGSPADPGIWLKTPLVTSLVAGRVDYQGASVNLELRPSGGEAGSGSQISLPAMRLLGAPLTGIIELKVFASAAGA